MMKKMFRSEQRAKKKILEMEQRAVSGVGLDGFHSNKGGSTSVGSHSSGASNGLDMSNMYHIPNNGTWIGINKSSTILNNIEEFDKELIIPKNKSPLTIQNGHQNVNLLDDESLIIKGQKDYGSSSSYLNWYNNETKPIEIGDVNSFSAPDGVTDSSGGVDTIQWLNEVR